MNFLLVVTLFASLTASDTGNIPAVNSAMANSYQTHAHSEFIAYHGQNTAPLLPLNELPAAGAVADFGVFRSVPISAAQLPAAAKWHKAREVDYTTFFSPECDVSGFANCDRPFARLAREAAQEAIGLGEHDMIDLVNRTINRAMTYREDSKVWGTDDYWANPMEMAGKGAGDCEDYAIAKYWMLRGLGVADEQLQLVILRDTRRQLFHAVLVAHMNSGNYVLDNVSNRVAADTFYSQYQPIMSFAGAKNFIHGFESGTTDVAALPADLNSIAPGSNL